MPNFNKSFLMGNLTKDPELRYTDGGAAVCNLRMAISRKWTDKAGTTKEEVCWVTVVCFSKQAEVCGGFLKKGDPIFVEGRLQSKEWETEAKERRSKLEVVANRVEFLMRGAKKEESTPDEGSPTTAATPAEEDIPF